MTEGEEGFSTRAIRAASVRMDRHAANALALATWLERQGGVRRVIADFERALAAAGSAAAVPAGV